MRIIRILNNNAVLAEDIEGKEVVALGKGIAFQKKCNEIIAERNIEKYFYPETHLQIRRMADTLTNIKPEFIDLADRIIRNAQVKFGKKLTNDIYIALPDHLQFAVDRYEKGMSIQNNLTIETRQVYPDEYAVGIAALQLINNEMNIQLPEDEATNIAMHFITATDGDTLTDTVETIKLVDRLISIIEQQLAKKIDHSTIQYYRIITHLKFFIQRIKKNDNCQNKLVDENLFQLIKVRYETEYRVAQVIASEIESNLGYPVQEEEIMYLTIHIRRINE